MVSNEESKFLFKEKLINDRSELEASKEIRNLEDSQKALRSLWANKESLKRENERLIKEIEKLKQSKFKLRFELDKKNSANQVVNYSGGLLQLNRIINFMAKDKEYNMSSLAKELMIKPTDLKGCIDFLDKNNCIKLKRTNRSGMEILCRI